MGTLKHNEIFIEIIKKMTIKNCVGFADMTLDFNDSTATYPLTVTNTQFLNSVVVASDMVNTIEPLSYLFRYLFNLAGLPVYDYDNDITSAFDAPPGQMCVINIEFLHNRINYVYIVKLSNKGIEEEGLFTNDNVIEYNFDLHYTLICKDLFRMFTYFPVEFLDEIVESHKELINGLLSEKKFLDFLNVTLVKTVEYLDKPLIYDGKEGLSVCNPATDEYTNIDDAAYTIKTFVYLTILISGTSILGKKLIIDNVYGIPNNAKEILLALNTSFSNNTLSQLIILDTETFNHYVEKLHPGILHHSVSTSDAAGNKQKRIVSSKDSQLKCLPAPKY